MPFISRIGPRSDDDTALSPVTLLPADQPWRLVVLPSTGSLSRVAPSLPEERTTSPMSLTFDLHRNPTPGE